MSKLRVEILEEAVLPTEFGKFRMIAFESGIKDFPHIIMYNEMPNDSDFMNVRIHSECLTGDLFSSLRCDCGEQLNSALKKFGQEGGMLIYLRQEGRGIGLINKMKAYNLQDSGLDTIRANHALGFETDARDFTLAVKILEHFGVEKVKLHTNNPNKIKVFETSAIEVIDRIPIEIDPREENEKYLKTKKEEMGHLLSKGRTD